MLHDRLQLEGRRYVESLGTLERLIRATPDLSNLADLRAFLAAVPPHLIGPRTARECARADDEGLRAVVHCLILGAATMADLHEASREWLRARGYAGPPREPRAESPAARPITYGGRVAAVVSREPERSIAFAPDLAPSERRWVLAMAIGAGERPEWRDADLRRFAAYLTMGGAGFAGDRQLSDAEIAAKHDVPEAAVSFRRSLADVDP